MLFGEGPQIKNIAADLNKLFRQGSLLNQSGQTVEGDSTADQGTSDLLAARDPVIQEISVGMSGEQSARYTVYGTPPLSLTNSLGKPLKAWSVDVLPYQEGSGDPSPDNVRAIHGTDKVTITTAGRNMLPNTATTQTINGVTFTVNADGSVTANGTATANAQLDVGSYTSTGMLVVASGCPANGSNTTYRMFSTYIGADYGNGVTSVASQFPSGRVSSVKIFVYSGYTAENLTFYPMIKFVDVPAGYTPYLAPSQTGLTLPQTVYTGTIGSEGGESRWGEVDLGTLTWTVSGNYYVSTALNDAVAPPSVNVAPNMLAEYAAVIALSQMTTSSVAIGMLSDKRLYTPTAMWENAPIGKLVYELEVSTTFSAPSVTIPTPAGTATTWATVEDGTVDGMEVTYVGKA